ncbi:unnamed protein product, partial [Rotaria sp. Silwood2]
KKTIAKENLFDLQGKTTAARRKKNHCCMNVKYFAITCWTNITKGNFVEFRSFPHPSKAPDQSRSGTPDIQSNKNGKRAIESACLPPPKRLTVRAEAAERRDINNQIADTALTIAEEDVPEAMRYVRKKMPKEFMYRSTNFHESFKYVNNEAQELKQDPVKEYMWDLSFPDCTKELHTAVTNWLNENFRNPHRPKCLVIIGPSGVGEHEHFHKAPSASASGTMDAPIVNHHRPLLGHPDEFAVAQREWLDAQNKRRAAVVSDPLVRSSGMDVEVLSDDSDIEML